MEIDNIYGYDYIIIDIRDETSFNLEHLDNSINIPMKRLIMNYDNLLNKKKSYLLICEYGIQSKLIMNMLNRLGYHVNSLINGYHGLKRQGKVR